jgi:hypothetical protein
VTRLHELDLIAPFVERTEQTVDAVARISVDAAMRPAYPL